MLLSGLVVVPLSDGAGQAGFFPLPPGSLIGNHGISSDGSVVVGNLTVSDEAFRWTLAGGASALGYLPGGSYSRAQSTDLSGTTVVGISDSLAFRWTRLGGMTSLGALPGGAASSALDVTPNGAVVVGYATSATTVEAFRWTAATGMVGLGAFPGQSALSYGRAVNGDGSVVVGQADMNGSLTPFKWTAPSGVVPLSLPPFATGGSADDVSGDGSVVVGGVWGPGTSEAYKWTASGPVGLGDLPGGPTLSRARGISDSGLVIVGQGRSNRGDEAVFWTPTQGPVVLSDHLSALGITAHQTWTLTYAAAVSADGRHIVGQDHRGRAWLAVLPESWSAYCIAKTNSLGCTPAVGGAGVPSATNVWSFEVAASNVRNQKAGVFIYKVGGTQTAQPFQGGTLCIGPTGIRRTIGVNSGGNPAPANDCSGVYSIDMNAFAAGLLGGNPDPALQTSGGTYHVQAWGRDQGFPPPNNTTLSNALEVPIGP